MNTIILSSQAWCDLIFANKNKEYGAYAIRMSSSKRHASALLIVTAVCISLFLLSCLFNKGQAQTITTSTTYDPLTFENLNTDPDIPIVAEPQPPVPIVSSIGFPPPVVAPDNQVSDQDAMLTQIELSESNAVIAGATHEGNTDGPGMVITDIDPVIIDPPVDNTVHVHVEQMPSYPGGDGELMAFLRDNLKYPITAQEQGIQGVVTLRFVVNKDGSVGDVEILRSLDPNCDKEAIRVVKKMTSWIPGKQNGMPVRVYYNLPVRFRISN